MSITTTKRELKRKRKQRMIRNVIIVAAVCLAALAAILIVLGKGGNKKDTDQTEVAVETTETETQTQTETETTTEYVITDDIADADVKTDDEVLALAYRYAAMYDYDNAVIALQSVEGYESNSQYTYAIDRFTKEKGNLVKWADNTQITHIFFHTLVVDTDLAFDGDADSANYNQVMTTVTEFNRILEQMYNQGYVLVSLYDVASMKTNEDGTQTMSYNEIYLPAGKKPFILSQDDVSYYAYMEDDGFATKLVIKDGKVTNEYVQADGTVVYGSYDVLPLLDDFIEEHPDFSYRGAKGTLALTGYEGVLGYRTSEYSYGANSTGNKDFKYVNANIEADRAAATEVANAIKADGWTFACHGWGHRAMGKDTAYENFVTDIDLWYGEVIPIIGACDILIYPKGDDIGNFWPYTNLEKQYAETWAKFEHCKALGFNYYCNVDSSQYWIQLNDQYLRTGRRNVDGTRLFEALCGYRDLLSDIIDVSSVWDTARPQPVSGVPVPAGYVYPDGTVAQ